MQQGTLTTAADQRQPVQSLNAGDPTLQVLASWFFMHCEAKNLQTGTLRFYRQKLCFLLGAHGGLSPDEVTTQTLRRLVVSLRSDRKWSTQQTNHFITACRVFFNFLEKEELISSNPTRRLERLKQEKKYPEVLSREDVQALLAVTSDSFSGLRDRVMLMTLLDTGMRLSELIGMTVDAIDYNTLQFRVYGKGRKERFVPFSPTLAKLLMKYRNKRKQAQTERLWINAKGGPLTASYFVHRLRRYYSVRAGITPPVHPHQFRHTFATEFLRNGGNPQILQRILGHTTQVMMQRYVHMTDADAAASHKTASPLERWHCCLQTGGPSTKKR